jgi:hypothetical protein
MDTQPDPNFFARYRSIFIGTNLVRLCLNCMNEYSISARQLNDANWEVTHSRCTRHLISILKQAGLSADNILRALDKMSEERKSKHGLETYDLSNYSAELVGWLRNPTPYPKKPNK